MPIVFYRQPKSSRRLPACNVTRHWLAVGVLTTKLTTRGKRRKMKYNFWFLASKFVPVLSTPLSCLIRNNGVWKILIPLFFIIFFHWGSCKGHSTVVSESIFKKARFVKFLSPIHSKIEKKWFNFFQIENTNQKVPIGTYRYKFEKYITYSHHM